MDYTFSVREYVDKEDCQAKYYDLQVCDEHGQLMHLDRVDYEIFAMSTEQQQDYIDKTYFGKEVKIEPHPNQRNLVFSNYREVAREEKTMDMLQKKILDLVKKENPLNPLGYVQDVVRDYARDKMDLYMSKCKECPLSCHSRSTTAGPSNAPLMVIGETPTQDQADDGHTKPLEGTEGYDMLMKVFDYYNVDHSKVFYMNAVNCLPYKEIDGKVLSRTPNRQELEACKVFLDHAIDIVQPKAILLLGNVALNAFINESLLKMRSQLLNVKGITAVATYNPNYFVQVRGIKDEEIIDELKQDFIGDIETLLLHMQDNYPESKLLTEKITID